MSFNLTIWFSNICSEIKENNLKFMSYDELYNSIDLAGTSTNEYQIKRRVDFIIKRMISRSWGNYNNETKIFNFDVEKIINELNI